MPWLSAIPQIVICGTLACAVLAGHRFVSRKRLSSSQRELRIAHGNGNLKLPLPVFADQGES